jgi:serine phosphatase RsbU (regulator of sigma subunit)
MEKTETMNEVEIGSSKALKKARLRSDRIRIIAMLTILCLLFVSTLLRGLILARETEKEALPLLMAYFGAMIGFECLMLRWVGSALRRKTDVSQASVILNVLVETLFPTAGIVLLILTGITNPYAALLAPIVLTYFLFVILSTLRLSPLLARLTGVFCAAEYALLSTFVFIRYPAPVVRQAMQPVEYYIGNAVIILAAGLLAGEIARQIRSHVSAALREAKTVERLNGELESARFVQQSLLPCETPGLGDYDLAGWNRPADQTGGDYYGWRQLADGRTIFMLADVTGHGISSALMAAACHAYIQASIAQDSNLDAIVTRINRLLCADLPSGKLITFVAGVLDPGTGCVDLLSAGHAPLLLYSAVEDRVQSFDAHGVPFGIFGTLAYGPAQKIQLTPGDMLVLITDGFFEWTNATGEDFGFDRLHAAIRAARGLSATDIISALHAAVTDFASGAAQQDDLTAVVLKRLR